MLQDRIRAIRAEGHRHRLASPLISTPDDRAASGASPTPSNTASAASEAPSSTEIAPLRLALRRAARADKAPNRASRNSSSQIPLSWRIDRTVRQVDPGSRQFEERSSQRAARQVSAPTYRAPLVLCKIAVGTSQMDAAISFYSRRSTALSCAALASTRPYTAADPPH